MNNYFSLAIFVPVCLNIKLSKANYSLKEICPEVWLLALLAYLYTLYTQNIAVPTWLLTQNIKSTYKYIHM